MRHGQAVEGGWCASCGHRVLVEDDGTRYCPGCKRIVRPTQEKGDE